MEYPRVVACTPFETPDARQAAALARAGALAVLDLGRDERVASEALAVLDHDATLRGDYAVRLPDGVTWDPARLPARARTIVLGAGAAIAPWKSASR